MMSVVRAKSCWPALLVLVWIAGGHGATAPSPEPGGRTLLHAHNCYPQAGRWSDRLDRALAIETPIVIEQDLVWRRDTSGAGGHSVVAHEPESAADAPTLEEHFFARVAPRLDRALAEGRSDSWPLMILHLDFKTNEAAHHQAVWRLLGRYQRWLSAAPRVEDDTRALPLAVGPLLVLTENGPGQEDAFHRRVPVGSLLRLFGTAPPGPMSAATNREEQLRALAEARVDTLIPQRATNYRRWTNHSWTVVEKGGPAQAGEWTEAERARLERLVDRAHGLGLWIRFYALNGHLPIDGRGWSESYNFGSLSAARTRWRAAIAAGVDFVATDQYEEFARLQAPAFGLQVPGSDSPAGPNVDLTVGSADATPLAARMLPVRSIDTPR